VFKHSKSTVKIKLFAIVIKQTNNFLMKFTENEIINEIKLEYDSVKLIEIDDIETIDHNNIITQIIK